ncbi:MAG: histidine ammonia-lyase, partial [Glycomyces artemisiae]|nr:histidine ammonia-lyase [Glycomyces artemisiae]
MSTVHIRPVPVSPEEVVAVARDRARVVIDDEAREAMARSRAVVDAIESDGRP